MSSAAPSQEQVCVDCDTSSQPAPVAEAKALEEDILDPSTFIAPITARTSSDLPTPTVVIEFCQRCRFFFRASWIQTELFQTFPPDEDYTIPSLEELKIEEEPKETKAVSTVGASLNAILLIPRTSQETGGRFRIWLSTKDRVGLVWDRKTRGGFPELRQLKQIIRDKIAPTQSLGHSDKKV